MTRVASRCAAGLALLVLLRATAAALDAFEIQVYGPEMSSPARFGLEVHANAVAQGRKDPETSTEIPPHHQAHLTLEPSLGLAPWWEAGAYLQFAYAPESYRSETSYSSRLFYAGTKLRTKFAPAGYSGKGSFYALNLEVSNVPDQFEAHRWATEVRPILGVERARWYLSVNPILAWDLSGEGAGGYPSFEPCGKVRWDTRRGFGLGVEYYAGLGKLDGFLAPSEQEHYLYAVYELLREGLEFNLGLGRGLTAASNDWTLKSIAGWSF